ncbi:uncharacterized protein WM277_008635 isoform 1-T1 [Molossus nigricans]
MARTATVAAPRAPRLLRATLLLLLLVAACRHAAGETRNPRAGQGRWVGAHWGNSPTNRVCCPRRGARGQGTALPVLADQAGSSSQERPECGGDVLRTPLPPNRSHSHSQEWTSSLSQPSSAPG